MRSYELFDVILCRSFLRDPDATSLAEEPPRLNAKKGPKEKIEDAVEQLILFESLKDLYKQVNFFLSGIEREFDLSNLSITKPKDLYKIWVYPSFARLRALWDPLDLGDLESNPIPILDSLIKEGSFTSYYVFKEKSAIIPRYIRAFPSFSYVEEVLDLKKSDFKEVSSYIRTLSNEHKIYRGPEGLRVLEVFHPVTLLDLEGIIGVPIRVFPL